MLLCISTETSSEADVDHCRISLSGALGADTVGALEEHIDRLDCCATTKLTIDLHRLDHLDDTGARVLHGFRLYAAARGCNFRLVGASPAACFALQEAADDMALCG